MTVEENSIQVEKLGKNIVVSFDAENIKIQGDSISKKGKNQTVFH